jgi:hypothetical protein
MKERVDTWGVSTIKNSGIHFKRFFGGGFFRL